VKRKCGKFARGKFSSDSFRSSLFSFIFTIFRHTAINNDAGLPDVNKSSKNGH